MTPLKPVALSNKWWTHMAAWEAISAFQFTTAMHLASLPIGNGRTYHHNLRYYTVTLDPHTSRGYVEFPWDEQEGDTVGFDGTTLWALPWMTQLAHVRLSRKPQASLPTYDGSFHVVAMQFNPPGKTHEGGFELYIDPETFLIRGFTQTTSFPLLPGMFCPLPLRLRRSLACTASSTPTQPPTASPYRARIPRSVNRKRRSPCLVPI